MKTLSLPVLALLFPFFISSVNRTPRAAEKPNGVLEGTVMMTESWCGGVDPGPEVLGNIATPHPAAGYKFFIRKGMVNDLQKPIVDSFLTGPEGNFKLELPAGDYCIIFPVQRDSAHFFHYRNPGSDMRITDEKCLRQWFRNQVDVVSIRPSATTRVQMSFHSGCFLPLGSDCLSYEGPYPP